jgi:hypothetical protein
VGNGALLRFGIAARQPGFPIQLLNSFVMAIVQN